MASLPISALPLKTTLDTADLFLIVDTQYGAENYISKSTTVGAILDIAQDYFVAKIDFAGIVATVNGKSGNVILNLAELGDVAFNSPANEELLAYNSDQQKWINKSTENDVLDCGTF